MDTTTRLRLEALPNTDTSHAGSVDIVGERFTLGRAEGNDWVLADPKRVISKTHAVIEQRDGRYRLLDRSTNGTSVNGRALGKGEGHVLRGGDEITIGGYGFRVSSGEAAPGPATGGAPAITSILHDLVPQGVGASLPIPGERSDIEAATATPPSGLGSADPTGSLSASLDRPSGEGRGNGVALPLGWDAPPGDNAPDIGSQAPAGTGARDLTDRSEQAPADRRLVDLPVVPSQPAAPTEPAQPSGVAAPKPIIPLDWLDDEGSNGASSPSDPVPSPTLPNNDASTAATPAKSPVAVPEAARPPIDTRSIEVVPVTNIDVGPEPGGALARSSATITSPSATLPAATPPAFGLEGAEPSPDIAGEIARGAGIDAERLRQGEAERLLNNAGRALAIVAEELQALQATRTRLGSRLGLAKPERTPWINAIGTGESAEAPRALLQALAECEPGEVEGLRSDLREIGAFHGRLVDAAVQTAADVDDALDPTKLRGRIRFLDRFRSGGKVAALWRALLRDERVFAAKARPRVAALLADKFSAPSEGEGR